MNEGYQQLVDDVLRKRYYLRDENGKLLEETSEEMFERVAVAIAKAEDDPQEWEKKFFEVLTTKRFMASSPTLVNAGTEAGTLSSCFVIPVEDSLEDIYKALTDAAKVHKAFGGTGFSFSRLRPKGDVIGSTGGSAAGPVAFMKLFDASADAVRQGGRREGANMGILDVDHPDIEEFIVCKDREGVLRHFNISVAITDAFMIAMRDGLPFPLINRRTCEVVKRINPSELFDKIAYQAWKNGEPGVVFIDTINKFNTCPHLGRIEATNPCLATGTKVYVLKSIHVDHSSVTLALDYVPIENVRIGDYILTKDLRPARVRGVICNGRKPTKRYYFDNKSGYSLKCTPDHKVWTEHGWMPIEQAWQQQVKVATYSASNGIEYVPIVSVGDFGYEVVWDLVVEDETRSFIANGVIVHNCGEQPLLPYESCNLGSINLSAHVNDSEIDWDRLEETIRIAVRFLDDVITVNKYPIPEIEKATLRTRKIGLGVMGWHDMLIKLGVPYDSEQALRLAEQIMSFIQNVSVDESMNLAEERGPFPAFEGSWWDHEGSNPLRNATTTTIAPTGSISLIAGCSPSIEPVFQWLYRRMTEYGQYDVVHPLLVEMFGDRWEDRVKNDPELFKTALDISWEWHIRMQAAFQKYTHNAVSKTINMPQTATVEDVKRAIIMAWKLGCKGITIYRVGSRQEEVMSVKSMSVGRPRALSGTTIKARSGCGKMYVTINMKDGQPYEVFVRTAGGCEANNEAIGRLISLALRNGIPVERVIRQLRKVKCINAMRSEKSEGRSCADVIGSLLEQFVGGEQSVEDEGRRCPECGAKLTFGEGCMTGSCPNCGWSGCG